MFFEDHGVDLQYLYRSLLVQFPNLCTSRHPLSIGQVSALKSKLYDLLAIPDLGLALGKQVRTAVFFPRKAELFKVRQPTFMELLKLISRDITDSFPSVSLRYFETDKSVGLRMESYNDTDSSNRMTIENFVVNLHSQLTLFLGDGVGPEYIEFNYSKPTYGDVYDQYLDCDLRFDSAHSAIVIAKEVASQKILLTEQNYRQIKELYLSGSSLPFKLSALSKRFNVMLSSLSDESFPSLEASAHRLCVSARTFRRHLKMLNTSYFNEIQNFRKGKAIELLMNSNSSITDIALTLGFCDASAFNNAFKKWTGKTPGQFKGRGSES